VLITAASDKDYCFGLEFSAFSPRFQEYAPFWNLRTFTLPSHRADTVRRRACLAWRSQLYSKSEMAEKIGFSTDFRLCLFLPVCLAPYSASSCCEGGIRKLRILHSPLSSPHHSNHSSSLLPTQNHALRNTLHLASRLSLRPPHSC